VCSSDLWAPSSGVTYHPGVVSRAGFALGAASQDAAVAGDYGDLDLTASAPALVGWGEAWGVRAGDTLTITLRGPDGAVLAEHADAVPHEQARRFAFAGVRRPSTGWLLGDYQVEVALSRQGIDIPALHRAATVTMRADD